MSRRLNILFAALASLASSASAATPPTVITNRFEIKEVLEASAATLKAIPAYTSPATFEQNGDQLSILTATLPVELWPILPRVASVDDLYAKSADGHFRPVPLAYEPTTKTILLDSGPGEKIDLFGRLVSPKADAAMIFEVALEARLATLGDPALRELGLDVVTDDSEWCRLNGPGPDKNWACDYDPALERQRILRALLSPHPSFLLRLGEGTDKQQDRVLTEKTRLMLYATFVASGGLIDQKFWMRVYPRSRVMKDLTRDFDKGFLSRIEERLERNFETRSVRVRLE